MTYQMQSLSRRLTGSSLLLAALATAGFYGLVQLPWLADTVVARYTTGHAVEYVTVALCLWALADLCIKWLQLRAERAVVRRQWLPPCDGPQTVACVDDLLASLPLDKDALADTYLVRRLRSALQYVRDKRSADQLEEHLRYLAELDAERSHSGFALARVIAWMIPILGFLGTVIGITLAIAKITPEQLEGSLAQVTGGLAVAFDTTALALCLSMLLMFVIFLVERSEQMVLHSVEELAHATLAHRFATGSPQAEPYLAAVRSASEAVITHTQELLRQQVELWSQSIANTHEQQQQRNQDLEGRLLQTLESLASEGVRQAQIQAKGTAKMAELQERLQTIGELLADVVNGEGQLVASQRRLAENMHTLRQTQSFDEALHGLIAAIHLLTIRTQAQSGSEELAA